MNLLSLSMLATGGVLIYCSLRGYDPREVVKAAVMGDPMPDPAYVIEGGDGLGNFDLGEDGLIPGELPDIPNIPDPGDLDQVLPILTRSPLGTPINRPMI